MKLIKPLIQLYTILLFSVGFLYLNFTVDDAFITFRYAKNLVSYGTWNWNPTTYDLVEAYTSFIYTAIAIIPHLLKINVVWIYKILGLILIISTFNLLTKKLHNDLKWLGAAFIATNFSIFLHAFSGLETVGFFFLALYTMTLHGRAIDDKSTCWIILLAPLIRPEGAIISLYIIYLQIKKNRTIKLHSLIAIGAGGLYFVIRAIYFGHLLPNTYYIKSGDHNSYLHFIENFTSHKYLILAAILSILLIHFRKGNVFLPILLLLGFIFGNMTSDLQMNYVFRFAWHLIVPTIFYAFFLEIRNLRNYRNLSSPKLYIPVIIIFAGVAKLNYCLDQYEHLLKYYPDAIRCHRAIGIMLSKYKENHPILATGDSGLIPYYADMETIDTIGLGNANIGMSIVNKTNPNLKSPDIFVVYSGLQSQCNSNTALNLVPGEIFLRKKITQENYTCVEGIKWGNNYYLNFLINNKWNGKTDLIKDIDKLRIDQKVMTNQEYLIRLLKLEGLKTP